MKDAFHEASSGNLAVVILSDEKGLSPADEEVYRTLVTKLRADTEKVRSTQDFVHIPELRQVMTSQDKKAWNLPVNLGGVMGTGDGQRAYQDVVKIVKETTANTTLTANVIGPAATLDDLTKTGAEDQHIIEIATVLMVLTILMVVYRNVIAMLLPLVTIGISLVVAQQLVAALGDAGHHSDRSSDPGADDGDDARRGHRLRRLPVQSLPRMRARWAWQSDDALVEALGTIGKVIAGSAGTVAITFFGLIFTSLGIFSTIGPALSVTIGVGFLASITLLPAFIVLAGRRGWIKPRRDMTGRFWRRSGIQIARRPKIHLAVSLVILVALASCTLLVHYNYDDRKTLPPDTPSNRGYAAMDAHFPVAGTLQQFILDPFADSRPAVPEVAGRSGADGPAGEPTARHQPGARHHATDR